MNKSFAATSITLLVALCGLASPAAQQQAAPQNAQGGQGGVPTLKITTRLVVVDVVATDHKGHPVTDLKPEDFSLAEEGAEQKIRVFNFQQPAATEAAQPAPVKLPPNMATNIPTYKTNRTLSVLLLDALNTDVTSQKYARQQMLKYLEKLPAGQPVAVFALGSRLHLLQDFTSDPSLLQEAIRKPRDHTSPLAGSAPGGANSPALTSASAEALAQLGLQSMLTQIELFQREQTALQTDLRVEITLAALKSLGRTLAGYPGRKNLIWVSSAFPIALYASPNLVNSSNVRAQEAALSPGSNYARDVEQVSSILSNARVAVYPVDTRALAGYGVYSNFSNTDSNGNYLGSTALGRVGGSAREGRGAMGAELSGTTEALQTAHSTMNTMAERTGGKAFYNTNYIDEAIRDGIEDGSTYYTLGYYPENKNWDGKFRKIVVKTNRPGVKLHYRQGYMAADPKAYEKLEPKQQAIDFGQALNLEYPVSTALLFRAAVIPPSDKTGNHLQINYGVDAHALSFELQDDGLQHTSVDCAVQAFTIQGKGLEVHAQKFDAALKPEAYQMVMQKFFPCSQTLDLLPGDYVLRLGVRDNSTGLIGTANARVTVPAAVSSAGGGGREAH